MCRNISELYPLVRTWSQAVVYQVLYTGHLANIRHTTPYLARCGYVVTHGESSTADGIICVKGDVPLQHVIQEHPQGPHGAWQGKVDPVHDPLRRGVHPCAIIILPAGAAVTAGEESARSKVNQLDLQCGPVNEDVLVLDISMDNPPLMTRENCFDCLNT